MAVKCLRFGLPFLALFIVICLALSSDRAVAVSNNNKITVAVASNFLSTMKQLVDTYQKDTGRVVQLSGGSTGKHYAQILHGAPFDLFFAADDLRPKMLENKQFGVKGSRFTYAEGSLVVWSPKIHRHNSPVSAPLDREALKALLNNPGVKTLAMANPKLAPYGRAAQDVMKFLLPGDNAPEYGRKFKVIRGENISQTFQFVMSGTADIAFLAHSQVLDYHKMVSEKYRLIPRELYQPIKQQAILLNNEESTQLFVSFIKGSVASSIIESNGYRVEGVANAR